MSLNKQIDEYIPVRVKATGEIIALPSIKEFSPFLHEKHEGKPVVSAPAPVLKVPVPKEVQPDEEDAKEAAPTFALNPDAEFANLTKQRAWLKPELQERYYELKELLGAKEQ